ncbi:MAG: tRNA dihydrouridine synthase DusB [Candidatus Wallbacteria bacterium]|nr:tRNA dihydrouridine synthase DusB [Candidatus Wallbacteria bacterium]
MIPYDGASEMFQDSSKPLVLAPMAGFTDPPFRALCHEGGADVVVAEMVSAKAICHRNEKTLAMLRSFPGERPVVWQLFGCDAGELADAATYIESLGQADGIDINMGCPMPKITGPGAGAALLRDVDAVSRMLQRVARAVRLPVSIKMRTGWDSKSIVAPEIAQAAAAAGCAQVHVHGRTSKQLYEGYADLEVIARVKAACPIPVIGNGDVTTPEAALRMFRETGCDGVGIARGALGNPWIFSRIKSFFLTGQLDPEPSWWEKVAGAARHFKRALDFYGDDPSCYRGLKGHLVKYFTGHPGASQLRHRIGSVQSNQEMERLIAEAGAAHPLAA